MSTLQTTRYPVYRSYSVRQTAGLYQYMQIIPYIYIVLLFAAAAGAGETHLLDKAQITLRYHTPNVVFLPQRKRADSKKMNELFFLMQ